MTATVMPQGTFVPPTVEGETGHWETRQNPVTGDIERVWVEDVNEVHPDGGARVIKCQANAIITGGLNSQGTTERWTSKGSYENVDFVEMRVGPDVILKRRDRVTNILGPNGEQLWVEEDHPDASGNFPATVFQVRGVAPSLDIFNRPIENFVLLERAQNQESEPGVING